MFEAICGKGALRNVVLTTTMWDRVPQETCLKRETQLRTHLWRSMLSRGCRIARFDSTWESAWTIIDGFSAESRRSLRLQREIVDEKKDLSLTSAFAALYSRFKAKFRRKHAASQGR
jgi:hypothetical protein